MTLISFAWKLKSHLCWKLESSLVLLVVETVFRMCWLKKVFGVEKEIDFLG